MNEKPRIKEEFDFRDLIRNPIRLFGYSYFYFLIVILLIGLYYIKSFDQISRNELTPRYIDSTMIEGDLPVRAPARIPPMNIMQISIPKPDLLEKGKALYASNCASCHGETGLGDGPSGLVLNPKPRNLTSPDGWINGRKVAEIFRTLEEGLLKTGMPSYNHLAFEDRFALIHAVRLFANDSPSDTEEELKKLDEEYKLSEGSIQTAQIPVKIATLKVLEDSKVLSEKAQKILDAFRKEETGEAARLFEKLCIDRKRAATILASADLSQIRKEEFINIITAAPEECGFDPKVIQLRKSDWDALHQYCVRTLQRIRP